MKGWLAFATVASATVIDAIALLVVILGTIEATAGAIDGFAWRAITVAQLDRQRL